MVKLISLNILLVVLSLRAPAQCTPPGGVPVVACGTGTGLSDNTTITTGTFNATGGSFSGITLSGGTLVLCGTVTLTDFTINSGNLIVNAGASVTVNPNYNSNGGSIFNLGSMTFNTSVGIQGTNAVAYNAVGASATVNGTLTVFNSGDFYNNGTAIAQSVIINSGAALCAADGSTADVTSLTNNQTNSITVPSGGHACIHYTGTLTANNAPITSGGTLIICEDPSASPPTGSLGSAMLVTNCTNCQGALPVTFLSFTGRRNGDYVNLQWTIAAVDNLKGFAIQRSTDGQHFQTIDTAAAHNGSATYGYGTPISADTWFRLQMIDRNGQYAWSPIVFIELAVAGFDLSIRSNPVRDSYLSVSIHTPGSQTAEMAVCDNVGRRLRIYPVALKTGINDLRVPLDGLLSGLYYLYFKSSSGTTKVLPFLKM